MRSNIDTQASTRGACTLSDKHSSQTDPSYSFHHTLSQQPGWLINYPGIEEAVDRQARKLHRRQSIQDSIPPDLYDIKQDMRVELLEKEHKYDPVRCDPGGFAYTVLQNYIKTKQRYRNRKCRKKHFDARSFDELRDSTHASSTDPVAEQIEKQDLIEHCKKKLTDAQLQILQLRTEQSLRELASNQKISYRKLRSMLADIRETCSSLKNPARKRTTQSKTA